MADAQEAPKKEAPKAQTFTKEEMQEAINAAVQSTVQAQQPAPQPAQISVNGLVTFIAVLGVLGSLALIIYSIILWARWEYGGEWYIGLTMLINGIIVFVLNMILIVLMNISHRLKK